MSAPRRAGGAGAAALAAAALGACSSTRPLPAPAQLEAIETRRIAGTKDAAFRAAAGVMLDRGMLITLSDGSAGLISGHSWLGFPYAHHAHTPDSLNGPTGLTVWVRPASAGESVLRVQFSYGGASRPDAAGVSRFVSEVEGRVMLASGPGGGP